jgi:hypothetical protein
MPLFIKQDIALIFIYLAVFGYSDIITQQFNIKSNHIYYALYLTMFLIIGIVILFTIK